MKSLIVCTNRQGANYPARPGNCIACITIIAIEAPLATLRGILYSIDPVQDRQLPIESVPHTRQRLGQSNGRRAAPIPTAACSKRLAIYPGFR